MFQDYLLRRLCRLSTSEEFRPSIPTYIPDVVEIIGPGASGKSTFMNIISIICKGNENKDINFDLRSKMNSLMNPKRNELTFSVKLKSFDGSFTLAAEKKDPKSPFIDLNINDNGQISKDFDEKCVLIHTIPMGPSNIMVPMVHDIEKEQGELIHNIDLLEIEVRKAIDKSDNTRVERINELKKQNKGRREKYEVYKGKVAATENRLIKLMVATSRDGLNDCESNIKRYALDKKRLEEEIGPQVNKINQDGKTYKKKEREIKDKCAALRIQYNNTVLQLIALSNIQDSLKDGLKKWQKISLDNIEDELKIDKNFGILIDELQLDIQKIKSANRHIIKENGYYTGIKKALLADSEFVNTNFAGLDNIKISGLVSEIDTFLKSHGDVNIPVMDECINNLRDLGNKIKDLAGIFSKFKSLRDEFNKAKNYKEISDIEEKKEKLNGVNDLITYWKDQEKIYLDIKTTGRNRYKELFDNEDCKIGEGDLTEYKGTQLPGLVENIRGLQGLLNSQMGELEAIEDVIKQSETEIQTKENEKPGEWEGCYEDLKKLLQDIRFIRNKFKEMDHYLSTIGDYEDDENIDPDQLKYYNALFSYFAKIQPNIEHNHKNYDVIRIDPIGFISKDNIRIYFDDMGGSEGQIAFLNNQLDSLEISGDSRKIVLLADEVGNIDAHGSIELKERMIRLRNENRLLFGATVRPENDPNKINDPVEIYDIMDGGKIWKI